MTVDETVSEDSGGTGSTSVDVPVPMSRVPEYDRAARELLWYVFNELMAAQDPVLSQIKRVQVDHIPAEPSPPGVTVGAYPGGAPVPITFTDTVESMINMDLDAWVEMVQKSVDDALPIQIRQLFEQMENVLRDSGQLIDAKGRPFSIELFFELLEKVQIDFDSEGKPKLPTLVVGPELFRRMQAQGPLTDSQKKRLEEIIAKKKQDFDARRRVRKLD
jgi:hypothetical protein